MDQSVQWMTLQELRDELEGTRPVGDAGLDVDRVLAHADDGLWQSCRGRFTERMIRTTILVSGASAVFLLAGCSTSNDPCVAYRDAIQRWGARSEANAYAALTMIENMQHGVSTQESVTTYLETLRDEHATWPEIQILSKAKYDAMDKCPGAESP